MNKQLGNDLSPLDMVNLLRDNCDTVEEIGYTKFFTDEELVEKKDTLADKSIELNNISEEKAVVIADFGKKMKPIAKDIHKILTDIKQKSEYVNGKCYKFIDQEERMIGYYDNNGVLVDTRKARPEELQGNIFKMQKTGTSN